MHSRQAKYASLVALALFGLVAVAQAAAPHGRHNSAHLGSPGETEAPKPVTLTKEETKSFLEDTIKAIRQDVVDGLVKASFAFQDGHPIEDDVTVVGGRVTKPFPAQLEKIENEITEN